MTEGIFLNLDQPFRWGWQLWKLHLCVLLLKVLVALGGCHTFAGTFLGGALSGPSGVYILHLHSSFEKEVWDNQEVILWQFLEIGFLLLGQWDCPVDSDSPSVLSVAQPFILLWNLSSFFHLHGLAFWSLWTRGIMMELTKKCCVQIWYPHYQYVQKKGG